MCHSTPPLGARAGDVQQREWTVRTSDGGEMPAFLALPAETPAPAVLVAGDMYGRSAFYEELCRRLAEAGFVAACPELFFRQGALAENTPELGRERWRALDEVRALDDLASTLDHLASLPETTDERRATMGFCLGGTQVLNLAARRSDVATVCYYGFPQGSSVSHRSAPPPLSVVASVTGPILGLWGGDDAAVGREPVEQFVAALRAHDIETEHHLYAGAGHGFMAAAAREPSPEAEERAADAWQRTLAFLHSHLAPVGH